VYLICKCYSINTSALPGSQENVQPSVTSAPALTESAIPASARAHRPVAKQWVNCFHWACWEWMTQDINREETYKLAAAHRGSKTQRDRTNWTDVGLVRVVKTRSALSFLSQWFVVFSPQFCTPTPPCQHRGQHTHPANPEPLRQPHRSRRNVLPSPWLPRSGWLGAVRWCCGSPSPSCLCSSSCRCRSKAPRRLPSLDTSRPPDPFVSFLLWPPDHRRARVSPPTRCLSYRPALPLCGKRPLLLLLLPLCCWRTITLQAATTTKSIALSPFHREMCGHRRFAVQNHTQSGGDVMSETESES